MTPEQISLVQDSFNKVVPISDTAAELFYARLFELDPRLKRLFRGDMSTQGRRLMTMISAAVHGLDDLESIVPAVRSLGIRHVAYGVEPEHYETVGAALLWTLQQGLGDDFTEDAREAWAAVYGQLSSTMIEAAYDKAA